MDRPWINAEDLKEFSEHYSVNEMSTTHIEAMITLAESKIIQHCHHDFSDKEKYPFIPSDVKTATLILADALCYNYNLKHNGALKGENFDDYSYTVETSEISTSFDVLEISSLLGPYVDDKGDFFFAIGAI